MIDSRDTLLIVDDREINIDILLSFLSEEYQVSVALNGETALKLARKLHPNLILLDVMLPDLNGFEVCRILKSDPRTRHIPVIFVTSLNQEPEEARGLDLGAVDYITRPFSPSLVMARIKNHLELERHRHNLERIVQRRTKDLQSAQLASVQCMAMLAEARDYNTGAHIQRTRKYVMLLGEDLEKNKKANRLVSMEELNLMAQASPLHDVGKIGLPDRILLKPGKLTVEEFEEMKKHTTYGGEILRNVEKEMGSIPFLVTAREIAENHHEKWDGSGYPRGLKKEQIPLSARIMAIADVYDALRSARPYKEAFSHRKALSIMAKESEEHFDPTLIDTFFDLEENFDMISKQIEEPYRCGCGAISAHGARESHT